MRCSVRKIAAATAAGVVAACGILWSAPLASAATTAPDTTYYVDAVNGSDSNAGTSPNAPWQSLAQVDATTFSPGDQILLAAGDTWNGQLHPLGSGSVGSPITIGSYGSGALPKIVGGSLASGGAVYLDDQQYWTIQDLDVTNDSGTDNLGDSAPGTIRDGILVDNTSGSGGLSDITIQDNDVHDVNGCFSCSAYDAHNNGGIAVIDDETNPLSYGSDSYNGVSILGNTVSDVGRTGIVFDDYSTGFFYTVSDDALSQNVNISHNTVTDPDSDGILLSGSQNNVMSYNVVNGAGQKTVASDTTEPSDAGLWPSKTLNTTIEHNEVSNTLTQQNVDGEGYDVDLDAVNTTLEYNYSHDNQGGFLLLEGGGFSGSNVTARYNLSVNDGWGGKKGIFTFAEGLLSNANIDDNTVYVAPGLDSNITYMDGWSGGPSLFDPFGLTTPWSFQNNLIVNHGTGTYTTPQSSNGVISNNLFYGNTPSGQPTGPTELEADPDMVDPSNTAPSGIGSVTGYQVSAGSPAIGAGGLIASNGGQDYFGDPVSATAAPTIGFFQSN